MEAEEADTAVARGAAAAGTLGERLCSRTLFLYQRRHHGKVESGRNLSDWITEEVSSRGRRSPGNRLNRHLRTLDDAGSNRYDQAFNGAGTASSGVSKRQENIRLERIGDVEAPLGPERTLRTVGRR